MNLKLFQVDAFTDTLFGGNPAAVCPLSEWIEESLMQKIAMENNLAETAFYVKKEGVYHIRWFTPTVEVDLCGHATLASAFVIFQEEGLSDGFLNFYSERSGNLEVSKNQDLLTLNFPSDDLQPLDLTEQLSACFNSNPIHAFKGKTDYVLVFNTEEEIVNLNPRLDLISNLDARGLIATARGEQVDFVSRFFAPQSGIPEDPVTGSAHTSLTPYWAKVLNKNELTAKQLSEREGYLICKHLNDRVEISGKCRLYLKGTININ